MKLGEQKETTRPFRRGAGLLADMRQLFFGNSPLGSLSLSPSCLGDFG